MVKFCIDFSRMMSRQVGERRELSATWFLLWPGSGRNKSLNEKTRIEYYFGKL